MYYCEGNENNFKSKAECEKSCVKKHQGWFQEHNQLISIDAVNIKYSSIKYSKSRLSK